MFTTRLISGIVLVILAAFLLVKGADASVCWCPWHISLIGLFELYRVMKIEKELPGRGGLSGGRSGVLCASVWTGMDASCDASLPSRR